MASHSWPRDKCPTSIGLCRTGETMIEVDFVICLCTCKSSDIYFYRKEMIG